MILKITLIVVALRLLWSGGVQLFAAWRLHPERMSDIGGKVYRDNLYSGVFDALISLVILFGATVGRINLDFPAWASVIMVLLFHLKYNAVDRIALTLAGLVKPKE